MASFRSRRRSPFSRLVSRRNDLFFNLGLNGGEPEPGWRVLQYALDFGFLSAGGGRQFTGILRQIRADDRIWVKIPSNGGNIHGYIGVCYATGVAQRARVFRPRNGERTIYEIHPGYANDDEYLEEEERCEWYLPVEFAQLVPLDQLVWEPGMFFYRGVACRPNCRKWRYDTLPVLRTRFSNYNQRGGGDLAV